MIITIIAIILLAVSIKTIIDAKNQKEIDRLEMIDFEMRFENLEKKLNKLLKKLNKNGKDKKR
tara:strand:+ start:707 stop:895 length:189 start_codon:yes stop_codon:yes gene_type:complete